MARQPVDEKTYQMALACIKASFVQGTDPVERLQRHGLLLTPAEDRRIRLEAMKFILEQMTDWSPAQFLRRNHRVLEATTQSDLYICIRQWLEDHIAAVEGAK